MTSKDISDQGFIQVFFSYWGGGGGGGGRGIFGIKVCETTHPCRGCPEIESGSRLTAQRLHSKLVIRTGIVYCKGLR